MVTAADDFEEYDRELPMKYDHVKVEIDQDIRNSPYHIDSSVDGLGDVILDKAPDGDSGIKALSKLSIDVDWQISAEQRTHMCYLHGVKIINRTVFTLPLWDFPEDTSQTDMEKWDSFIESANMYQAENRKIILRHLDNFKTELENIRPTRKCDELRKKINDMGGAHLQASANEINALALETNYGKDYKSLDYPDFYSNRPEQMSETVTEETAKNNEAKDSRGKVNRSDRKRK